MPKQSGQANRLPHLFHLSDRNRHCCEAQRLPAPGKRVTRPRAGPITAPGPLLHRRRSPRCAAPGEPISTSIFPSPDGICYHGYALSGGKKRSSGPLSLKRELRELVISVQAKQKDLDERGLFAGKTWTAKSPS